MGKKLTQLLLFRDFAQDAVIKAYDEAENSNDKKKWHIFFEELISKGESLGLSGRLFPAYIVYLLAGGNNMAADNIQRGGHAGKSVEKLLEMDMEAIFPALLKEIKKSEKIDEILNGYEPACESAFEAYKELRCSLESMHSVADAAQCLLNHYKKFGSGELARYRAFCWQNNTGLVGIEYFEKIRMADLVGYEKQKRMLISNTQVFLENKPANNILLAGARGTGKSSGVKALTNEFYKKNLRLVQITRDQIKVMPEIMKKLRFLAGYKFIIFLDDLSFNEGESEYKYLKSVIEGGVSAVPQNVLLYATSNRRHLIKETWRDREDTQEELYRNDSVNESISLSDRFGLIINYDAPSQDEYLSIIDSYLKKAGVEMEKEELRLEGLRWEMTHSGRSGRIARQFVNWYLGQKNKDDD